MAPEQSGAIFFARPSAKNLKMSGAGAPLKRAVVSMPTAQ